MGSLDVTLLVVAGLLALTLAVARLERRPLGTGSSDVGPGLILALGAAVMFWFTFMVGAAAVNAYTGGSSHDWGPAVTFAIAMIGSAFLGGVAGLSHGVAVFLLRHSFAVMIVSHRVVCSALIALAVLVTWFVWSSLSSAEQAFRSSPFLLIFAGLPFVLSILSVTVVSRLPGTRGDGGAA